MLEETLHSDKSWMNCSADARYTLRPQTQERRAPAKCLYV